ncbi:hypothetical protein TI04_00485 [Achromatium sp. WMS2]|nr:hypothetical protein TI04_00485 [Achromatium sp. WMS2]
MPNFPVIIENINIRQDDVGSFCLNDLHKDSGETNCHRHPMRLENQQTRELGTHQPQGKLKITHHQMQNWCMKTFRPIIQNIISRRHRSQRPSLLYRLLIVRYTQALP